MLTVQEKINRANQYMVKDYGNPVFKKDDPYPDHYETVETITVKQRLQNVDMSLISGEELLDQGHTMDSSNIPILSSAIYLWVNNEYDFLGDEIDDVLDFINESDLFNDQEDYEFATEVIRKD